VDPAAVRRLTGLFERAKFSRHAIDRAMRDEAVAALRAVRGDLAAAVHAERQAGAAAAAEAVHR
jgi:deoxycytidylate deaminase